MSRRIVLCLDGTWNSTYAEEKRQDGSKIVKPSNVLKFARAVRPVDRQGVDQIVYYDTGVGAMSHFPGPTNNLLHHADKWLGGGWGAGFESNIEHAITFLANNYRVGDEVYICGFSRGAATAIALTNFIDWMGGMPIKRDAYFIPQLLRCYVKHKGDASQLEPVIDEINDAFIEFDPTNPNPQTLNDFVKIKINFLGVWDTVLALGGRVFNISQRRFHLTDKPAACVKNARHALAIDEKRADFLPVIWKGRENPSQNLKQRWFPGVHSNVGGGYDKDGLANIAFHWMVDEVVDLGLNLEFDRKYMSYYRPYPQDLYTESKNLKYKIKDGVTLNNGLREIVTSYDSDYKDTDIDIHTAALDRVMSHPAEYDLTENELRYSRLDLYRPENLLNKLKQITNLDHYISGKTKGNSIDSLQRILKGGDILIDAKSKMADTGYDLEYNAKYEISLEVEQELIDRTIASDFSGWNTHSRNQNQSKHDWFKKLSRMKTANIFSLIGEVEGNKINFGEKWLGANKQCFTLSLSNEFSDKEVKGRLFVYLNDVPGFYKNNKGFYWITIVKVEP